MDHGVHNVYVGDDGCDDGDYDDNDDGDEHCVLNDDDGDDDDEEDEDDGGESDDGDDDNGDVLMTKCVRNVWNVGALATSQTTIQHSDGDDFWNNFEIEGNFESLGKFWILGEISDV